MKDMRVFGLFLMLCLSMPAIAQDYTSYFTGDTTDVTVTVQKGTVLMGGASENDNAMRWFLERAGGGDILVLRTSGEDGYNAYFFEDLGVDVNSVETILCNNKDASFNPYVLRRVAEADALWFAGGDQWEYIDYWRDTPMEDAFNVLINEKQITIGGTSAGCAIMGQAYFSAENGTIISNTALHNPYHNLVQLGNDDFLNNPATSNLITDTHYDNPDRRGRQVTFLARLMTDYGTPFYGIGVEEYTAVCIDELNIAHVYGSYPGDDDFAYFLQVNCYSPSGPEVCADGDLLTWDRNDAAIKVIKMAGTNSGSGMVDLNDWKTASGADFTWENWWVENAILKVTTEATEIDCTTPIAQSDNINSSLAINIEQDVLHIYTDVLLQQYKIYTITGQLIQSGEIFNNSIPIKQLVNGTYLLAITDAQQHTNFIEFVK